VAGVAAASTRIPNLRGIFFGDGPERDAVLGEIAARRAEAFIEAPGFAPSEQVDARLRSALCMLLPSSREGYGLIVVEASASGIPSIVVAGEDNAATELIEDGVNGVIVRRPDPEEIADAIVQVYDAGAAMRESTARWFDANSKRLSLESSLATVLAGYRRDRPSS
jgi:glycosyltransferase involved in cell wall biosynthesis